MDNVYYKALQAGSSVDSLMYEWIFFFDFIFFLIGASKHLGFWPALCVCEENIWSLAFVQSN